MNPNVNPNDSIPLSGGIPLDTPILQSARKFVEILAQSQAPGFISICPQSGGGIAIIADGAPMLLMGLLGAAEAVIGTSFGQTRPLKEVS
mgnify:CR=1 FL=1